MEEESSGLIDVQSSTLVRGFISTLLVPAYEQFTSLRSFLYSPVAQVSPVKPEGHKHWKLSNDSKFGTHEALLGQGSLEQEFYKGTIKAE